jgi:hypothetical protein
MAGPKFKPKRLQAGCESLTFQLHHRMNLIGSISRLTLSPVALVLQSMADIEKRPADDRED